MQNNDLQLIPYDLEVATIEGLKSKYMDITIPPEDKAAYAMVMVGLRECREIRLSVDAWHKDRKAWIVKAGKHYDGEKNRVHGLVEPIEEHLKAVRKVEDDRVEAIRAEKIRLEEERVAGIRAKIQVIKEMGEPNFFHKKTSEALSIPIEVLSETEITEDVYMEFKAEADQAMFDTLKALRSAYEDQLLFEKTEAERRAEAERLAKQKAEQEAEAKRLEDLRKAEEEKARKERAVIEAEAKAREDAYKAQQKALEDERRKIEAEKAAIEKAKRDEQERKDREEFERKAKEEARIKAENDAKSKADREAREAREKAEREAAEKARKAALAPDKDKILTWARELNQRLLDMHPDLSSEEAKRILFDAEKAIDKAVGIAVKQAKEL